MSEFDQEMKRGLLVYAALIVIVVAVVTSFSYWMNKTDPEPCTCRFQQHRVHFGDQYTKVNRKCIDLGNGSVRVGDTVYLDVKWFTNECE